MPTTRRDFLASGAAMPIIATLDSLDPNSSGSEAADSPLGQDHPSRVDFTGDGRGMTPAEFSQALASIVARSDTEADYYSRGGVVTDLENRMAEILGKERAVFLPTGTLANHMGVRIQAGGRRRVIVQEESHLYNDSGDCAAVLSGLNLVPLAHGRGTFTVDDVEAVIARADSGRVRTDVGVIVIESPIRRRLGELFDYDEMQRVCAFARHEGIATHLDGARLFMATGYTGLSPREIASHFDTVFVSMWKYFNAPTGAILAGPRALLDDLFHERRMFGGALPQAWPLAAVALHYVDGFEERFAAGVEAGEGLMTELQSLRGVRVERIPNGSNVFKLHLDADPAVVRTRLAARDVRVPGPAAGFRGFALKVNETLSWMPVEETVEAFAQATGN